MEIIYFLVSISLSEPAKADPDPRMAEIGWFEKKEDCEAAARAITNGSRAGFCLEGIFKYE